MGMDRFGNEYASGLPYARGRILRSTEASGTCSSDDRGSATGPTRSHAPPRLVGRVAVTRW